MSKFYSKVSILVAAFLCVVLTLSMIACDEGEKLTVAEENLKASESLEMTEEQRELTLESYNKNLEGVRVVENGSKSIVKGDNDYLAYEVSKMPEETLTTYADNIAELYEYTKEKGIPFLYVMAPQKGYYTQYPDGVDNFVEENCKAHLEDLKERGVPYLELRENMLESGISEEDAFYVTDHHWREETGFWATSEICKELSNRYGFEYDESVLDIENYNVKVYEDWFLGSQGKKAGCLFTDLYLDDFKLITPKFNTNLTVSRPLQDKTVTGSFLETFIQMQRVEPQNIYKNNTYAAYTGGDYHIQTIENHNKTDGEDILVMRDSYCCTVTPFLSLTSHNVHALDLRDYEGMAGDRVQSVSSYIDEMNPDYVLIVYYGVDKDDLKYTFEME